MNTTYTVLAFDFGASSGRAIKAAYKNGSLHYEEVHRFENNPIQQDGCLRWDFDTLCAEVRKGIKKAGAFDSIGFDTWGVDFGLLDKDGSLLELPVHYRDKRTEGMVSEALKIMDAPTLYRATGTQIMGINTLFQLLALKQQHPELLQKAETLLFMPDLFAYAIGGETVCEQTIASTAQLMTLADASWNQQLLKTFDLPQKLFAAPVPAGTVVRTLPEYGGAKLVAVAGHDTQCAVAAMPTLRRDVAFLSCGTWSLLGCELDKPILTEESMERGLSNELGANGRINYLKNIIGLWLIQESRREWRRQGREYSFSELEQMALTAQPLRCFIDPDDPLFTPPGDIPGRVRDYCRKTGQYVPQTVNEIIRCIYESLALKYRFALSQLEEVAHKKFHALHIVGGGTQAHLLCQMAADALGITVVAGPIEATALGNIMIQLVALGALKDLDSGRELIAATEKLNCFEPENAKPWDEAFEKFKNLL